MTDMTVANTILEQLGGRRFTMMTGSNTFVGDANSLRFKVGKNHKKVTHVRVTLNSRDEYDMEFIAVRGMSWNTLSKAKGVTCDNIREVFTDHTGLYTSL